MRPAAKAGRGRIPAVFDRGATQAAGMQRRSNAAGLSPRAARHHLAARAVLVVCSRESMLRLAAATVIAVAVLSVDSDGAWSTSGRPLGGAGAAIAATARPANQAPDGSTLKATAPIPQSPTDNESIGTVPAPVLVSTVATGRFVSSTFQYHFEVWVVPAGGTTALVEAGTVPPGTDRAIYPIRFCAQRRRQLSVAGSRRARGFHWSVVHLGNVHHAGRLDPDLCRRLLHPAEWSGHTLGLGRL